MEKMVNKNRDTSFDAFRGIAIIAVIAIHATYSGWTWYEKDPGGWNYSFTLMIQQVYVFAVPSFFFMAGYFVAPKKHVVKSKSVEFITSKLKRFLIPYLIWSAIIIFLLQRNYDLSNFAYKIILGKAQGPYYFLIALTCLTILSPYLLWLQQKPYGLPSIIFVNVISLIVVYYLRIFSYDGLPWWKAVLPFTTWIIFYYLGLMSKKRGLSSLIPGITTEKIAIIFLLTTLVISIAEAFFLENFFGKSSGGTSSVKFSSFLYSTSVISYFLLVRKSYKQFPPLLIIIGEYSFGIYLIHNFFRSRISNLLSSNSLLYSIQPVFQFFVVVSTLSICMVIIYTSRKLIGKSISSKYFGF